MADESDVQARPKPVFLSYARGDAQAMALKLRHALEPEMPVWQDVQRIEGGDWAGEITRALESSQAMLALLTPCAVGRGGPNCQRLTDSVCLDEIHRARFGSPPLPVVPIMVENCQPPLVLYRLHYHDFTRAKSSEQAFVAALDAVKQDLARAARGEPHYRSFVDRLQPLDFDNFLGSKRRGFVGRDWLFDKVSAFAKQAGTRAILIEGLGGMGKSSFLAELVHRNPEGMVIACHCCQADTPATLSPAEFVSTLASMIASQIPEYAAELDNPVVSDRLTRDRLEADPASAFEQGVLAPLQRVRPPNGSIKLLVVDALDEALLRPKAKADDQAPLTIVDLLSTRLDRFPPWLKLLATTRPERPVKARLVVATEVIDADDAQNRADLNQFIRGRLAEPCLQLLLTEADRSLDVVADELSRLAAGNFLYASSVLSEIESKLYGVNELKALPPTLDQKYAWFLSRQFPTEQSFAPLRAVLEALVAAEVALPQGDLAIVLGRSVKELAPLLARLASFIRSEPGAEPAYAVFHKSMIEWLTDPVREGELHFVRAADGHARLADRLWSAYQQSGAAALSRYAIAHLPAHLAACADNASDEASKSQRLEQLVKFVLDQGVQGHRFQKPAQVNAALRLSLSRAARGAEGRCLRLVFEAVWGLLSFRRSRLNPQALFANAIAGELDAFANELGVYQVDTAFRDLAALLGAWLAHDHNPDAARVFRQRLTLSPQSLPPLIERVDAALSDAPSPLPPLQMNVTEYDVRAIMAEVGGADLEMHSGFAGNSRGWTAPSPDTLAALRNGDDEAPVMLSELHGPALVAFAQNDARGRAAMLEYIKVQASNQYPIYRDLSLYKLVPAVIRHPDPGWTREILLALTSTALSGGELEFAEPAALAFDAVAARASGDRQFDDKCTEMIKHAKRLGQGRHRGDSWGEHRRRLAAAAEAFAMVMGGNATPLLEYADGLPRGYSGMEAYARLTLAESLLICGGPQAAIDAQLNVADASAQNIQDACFCALTSARVSTLRRKWWAAVRGGSFDVADAVLRLERGDGPAEFAVQHEIGRAYPKRDPGPSSVRLPDWLLSARTLAGVARVYQVSVAELEALNPTPLDSAQPPALIAVPDPGFRALLAAFLSAVALVAPELDDRRRVDLIQRLVPAALAKPTALHTVLGRLTLAAGRAGLVQGMNLRDAANHYASTAQSPLRPAGRALINEEPPLHCG